MGSAQCPKPEDQGNRQGSEGLDLECGVLLSCQRFGTRGPDCLPLESLRVLLGAAPGVNP